MLLASNLTTIPATQIYKDVENKTETVQSDQIINTRVLPCIIVLCDDPREIVPYTLQFMAHISVEIHCSADDKTDAEFDAMSEEVSNAFFDQTQPVGTPIDPLFLPNLLTSALENFTSQYARLTGQSSRVVDRRWVSSFIFELASCQADSE